MRGNYKLTILSCLIFWHTVAFGHPKCDSLFFQGETPDRETFAIPQTAEKLEAFIQKNPLAYHLFPLLSRVEIDNPVEVENDGWNNAGTYEGHWEGRTVFIKVLNEGSGIHEAAWLTFLNRHGLGARFYGLMTMKNRWALVMDKLPGENSKMMTRAPAELPEMERQIRALFHLHVQPRDLQFMVGDGQVVLIDTGRFISTRGEGMDVDAFIQKFIRDFDP